MTAAPPERPLDAVIVGAGLAGLYMLHRLRGLGLHARVFEAGSGIGGTWFWNRYPGARCDVESMEYSYQFSDELQQEWDWSERYASQPEILRYIEHVADRFGLRDGVTLDTTVRGARWDDAGGHWHVETDAGPASARFLIMATGCLSSTNLPDFPGRESYRGDTYHTGRWPEEEVDFRGKRVGVIGTGSSAIQAIPLIARQARHLTVFQRTPNYSIPAHNAPLDPETRRRVKARYAELRAHAKTMPFGLDTSPNEASALEVTSEQRRREYEARWERGGLAFLGAFGDLLESREANETAAGFLREKIRGIVRDPRVAEKLSPQTVVGCKRLCIDSDYFDTYNRDDVSLVDLREDPLETITPGGLRTASGEHELDAIVFATGFDAMTGALLRVDPRGRDDLRLSEKWAEGPRTYLGLSVAGFPNLFTITGPGSPSVLSNMIPSIEQHVEWIADCIAWLGRHDLARIEATADAEAAWVAHVNELADATLFPSCNSWYLGANVPGKPRVFMPCLGFPPYVEKCDEVAAKGYEGFALSR